jgi:hypothetical protein
MRWDSPGSSPATVRPQEKKQGRFRRAVRNQQHKSGKQQQAKDSELEVRATLQESVPVRHMLRQRHQQNEEAGEDQDDPAKPHPGCKQKRFLLLIGSATIRFAVQS